MLIITAGMVVAMGWQATGKPVTVESLDGAIKLTVDESTACISGLTIRGAPMRKMKGVLCVRVRVALRICAFARACASACQSNDACECCIH